MKAISKICQILAIVFGIGALVLFFVPFVEITTGEGTVSLVAAQLSFGGKFTVGELTGNMAKSSQILFCFLLTIIAVVMSAFSFKVKGLRYAAPCFSLVSAIYVLVKYLSAPIMFVDPRPLTDWSDMNYTTNALLLVIALFVFTAFAIVYLFVSDYLEVLASKGEKKTICQRIGLFFRDNKSEMKKITWPSFRDVVKNTVIVLIMCLVVGALIWLVDFGLAELIKVILGVQ